MKRMLPWLGIALLCAAAVFGFARRASRQMPDFDVYRVAGARVLAAETIYRGEDGHWQFKYLPAFAFVVAPLSQAPPLAARAIWYCLSVGLVVLLVNRAYVLLPDRRRPAAFLVALTVLALGKFYARELVLGQSNVLLAVLAMAALTAWCRGRPAAAGALFAAAAVVKPYAILFLPYLAARRSRRGLAGFGAVMLAALALPALRYGWAGNLAELRGWWDVVSSSTAPNLAGQDTVSIAGLFAVWLGAGPAAFWATAAASLALAGACAWTIGRGSRVSAPAYLDTALLLLAIPLLSPQGWDYVLLLATPAVMLLLDRLDVFAPAARGLLLACLALVGLTFFDVLGREAYRALMMSRILTVCALVEVGFLVRLRVRLAA